MMGIAKQFAALPSVNHLLIGIVLAFDIVAAPRLGMWAYSLFSLPGTAAHEFCHWLVALLLGAKPSLPNLIPTRDGNAWRLGSVRSSPNFITLIPIALAPFVLFPVGIWYAVFVMTSATGWWYLAHVWIASTMLAASLPSKQDWFVAMPAIVIALVLFFALRELGPV
ncbi:MAG: hypothetical protein A2342_08770 [Gallionellales bacterium RIFOXYB12_FULL_54_9]|nr:MAG: hypothetical protein A2342_08770 [Gallionellales bacterium RIFOXYB12_FULL_54_9]